MKPESFVVSSGVATMSYDQGVSPSTKFVVWAIVSFETLEMLYAAPPSALLLLLFVVNHLVFGSVTLFYVPSSLYLVGELSLP